MFAFTPEFYTEIASRLFDLQQKQFQAATKASKAAIDTEPPMSVEDVAKWLKVDPKTVRAKIANGKLRASDIGEGGKHNYRITKADLRHYLDTYANRNK